MSILTKIEPIVTAAYNSSSKICTIQMTNYNAVLTINLLNQTTYDNALFYTRCIVKRFMDNYRIITVSSPKYNTSKVFALSNGSSTNHIYNACLDEIWHQYLVENNLSGGTLYPKMYR